MPSQTMAEAHQHHHHCHKSKYTNSGSLDLAYLEQLQAYTAWVNSQLKKRPGSRVIQNLPIDMKDGVAFIQLIEVVAGESLHLNENPTSMAAMKDNVDQVLQFMAVNKIKMHHTSSKEILEGSLKAIMRLILALAAHFKPGSVKQTVQNSSLHAAPTGRKVARTPSAAAAAAGAAAAIAEASRAAANVGRHIPSRLKKHRADLLKTPKVEVEHSSASDTGSPMLPASDSLPGTPRKLSRSSVETPRETRSGRSTPGSGSNTPRRWRQDGSEHSGSDVESGASSKKKLLSKRVSTVATDFLYELSLDHDAMDDDVGETKGMLLELQKLLLDGRIEEDEVPVEHTHLEGVNLQEQLTIVNSRLSQQSAEYDQLKSERNKYKEECINLQGMKSGLLSRLNQQEEVIMQLKSELLKHGFEQQNRNADVAELHRKVDERNGEISAMRTELLRREKAMDRQRAEMEDMLREMEQMRYAEAASGHHGDESQVLELQQKIIELQEHLQAVTSHEADISSRIVTQDQKMLSLEQKILSSQNADQQGLSRPSTEEMDMVREAIQSLRECFRSHDPHQHTLDTLEQTITSLLDRPVLNGSFHREEEVNGVEYNDKYGYVKQHHRHDGSRVLERDGTGVSTKVLYFTEKTVTPFLTSIPKRLGNITLRDFKHMFDRPGPYRFHFKALDPEFGTVKEEVIEDDDIIPGWEGKIVAWVEEDMALLPRYSDGHSLASADRDG
ncbi:dixin isoform X2 [Nematostella vectensis]|uniref:dixin isoform X2 n=1 Tax=Nematostella vectensis TaxID=45351 RepID=UPI0020772390|nr:dixin isoform X2 [Nematostella vectensis]